MSLALSMGTERRRLAPSQPEASRGGFSLRRKTFSSIPFKHPAHLSKSGTGMPLHAGRDFQELAFLNSAGSIRDSDPTSGTPPRIARFPSNSPPRTVHYFE